MSEATSLNGILAELYGAGFSIDDIQNFVDQAESEAEQYAQDYLNTNNITDPNIRNDIQNALEHSYVSGRLVQEGMPNLAKILGAAKEYIAYDSNGNPTLDNYKDHWNNREGRAEGVVRPL